MQLFSAATLSELRRDIGMGRPKSADWQRLLARVDSWCAEEHAVPIQSGGWIHNYICPTHWHPLVYDGNKPQAHYCSEGHTLAGAAYDEAWLAWRHRQIADMTREVALAFAVTGERRYVAEVERVLVAYAAFYANFEGADSAETWMITARVFNQALTEALWAIPLIHAFDFVSADLSVSVYKQIKRDFLQPLGDTMAQSQDALIEKDHVESNYMAWFNVALGCIGFTLGDDALVTRAIDGAGGFIKHIDDGVLADGMQYEVTPYYHNFVVLAYLILAEAAAANGRDLYAVRGSQGQSLQSMWRALSPVTLPDGTIADLGDGSYWIDSVYDRELIEVYEIACVHDDDPAVAATLHNAYSRRKSNRDHWAALLLGTSESSRDLQARSEARFASAATGLSLLPEAGVAVLQASKRLAAVAPFGAHRGSHSHGDQLSLQVWPFSNDAGCVLYGIPARRDWYQNSYAHNTLVVDGQTQAQFSQATHAISRQDESSEIMLQATDAYGNCEVWRTVNVEPSSLHDTLRVAADATHTFDFVFHVDGDLHLDKNGIQKVDETAGFSEAGRQLMLTERLDGVNSAEFTIIHNGQTYTLTLSGAENFDLLLGSCPGTSWNPTERRRIIIGRTIGKSQTYQMTIAHD